MNLQEIYAKVDSILDTLDFGALLEGFHRYRFAVYDSRGPQARPLKARKSGDR